ncbi:RHS domain-containing protein, partial [Escherichia coli]|uniref:RHS domain-containing protein n=1 Tax=Escherichia coli TaxID=562 RepID=UPI00202685B3
VKMIDGMESEIVADRVGEESSRRLAAGGLNGEQMQKQMETGYTTARKSQLDHCDHRGMPMALISTEGGTAWCAECDGGVNRLNEENP